MSDSGGVTLDSVIINIETRAGESLDNIDNLAAALGNLKSAIKGGFHSINTLAEYIKTLNTASKKIPTINENLKPTGQITRKLHLLESVESPLGVKHAAQYLENLAVASQKIASTGQNLYAVDKLIYPLQELANVQSATGLGYTVKRLEEMAKIAPQISTIIEQVSRLPELVEPFQALKNIETPRGFGYITKNLTTLTDTLDKITPDALDRLGHVANELTIKLTPLAEKMNSIAQGFSALDKLASKYGITAGRVSKKTNNLSKYLDSIKKSTNNATKTMRKLTDASNDFAKRASKGFSSLFSKIKQVGLSLLGTRTLFTAVRKAVSEYAQMDSELAKSTTNLWRALGAQLAPAIEIVLYLFKQFVRVVYSIVYALTGIDLIARANAKALAAMGKSAKDTLGSLQKFDDLNVAEFNKDSGEDKFIELDKIDLSPIQKILDLVRKIKDEIRDAFDTGQWTGVGEAIADLWNYSFTKIKTADFKKALKKIVKPITETLNGIVRNLNWSDFGAAVSNVYSSVVSTVADTINNLDFGSFGSGLIDGLLSFDFSSYLGTWLDVFEAISGAVNSFVAAINDRWADLKKEASEVGVVLGKIFNEITLGINWSEIAVAVTEGINTLIETASSFVSTFDWRGFGETLASVVNSIFSTFDFSKLAKTFTSFLSGLLQALSSLVSKIDWFKIGESIVRFMLEVDWAQLSVDLLQFMQDLWTGMLDAASGVGASLGKWLSALFNGDDAEKEARTFGEKINDALMWGAIEGSKTKNKDMVSKAIGYIKGLIKGFFGIHSPSTWARDEIGANISQGFANGLSGMWDKSKRHFVTFVNGVIEIINNMIRSINNKLKISIGSSLSNILKALGVKVSGGTYQLFSIPTIPKLETGTNEILYEGLYHLHPGEAVVPKKYNPALGNGTDEELGQKLDALIGVMNNMNFTNVVNIGNKTIYKEQQRYTKKQNDIYGTTVNL